MAPRWIEAPKNADEFSFSNTRVRFRGRRGRNGRWYVSRIAGGNITDDASYASRRSARRAVLTRIARGD